MQVTELMQAKDRKLAEVEKKLRQQVMLKLIII